WRIANALLGHERLATANPQFPLMALDRIKAMARATGVIDDPAFQDRLAAASINVITLSALFSHAVELTNNAHSLGPESSIIKLFSSELLQALNELLVEAAGPHALAQEPVATSFGGVDVAASFFQSRRVTIYGGSSEIQRNVLARRVLNLPSSPPPFPPPEGGGRVRVGAERLSWSCVFPPSRACCVTARRSSLRRRERRWRADFATALRPSIPRVCARPASWVGSAFSFRGLPAGLASRSPSLHCCSSRP